MLLEQDGERVEGSTCGRFYVTYRLMKNLGKLDEALQTGRLEEQQNSLNNRTHSNGTAHIGRRKNRLETFGVSVHVPITLPEGIREI